MRSFFYRGKKQGLYFYFKKIKNVWGQRTDYFKKKQQIQLINFLTDPITLPLIIKKNTGGVL